MIETDKKIRKGLPPARNAACLQVQRDIVIPAGTILRSISAGVVGADVGIAPGVEAYFSVDDNGAALACGVFKRVIAA